MQKIAVAGRLLDRVPDACVRNSTARARPFRSRSSAATIAALSAMFRATKSSAFSRDRPPRPNRKVRHRE